jgi:hypothetical protein
MMNIKQPKNNILENSFVILSPLRGLLNRWWSRQFNNPSDVLRFINGSTPFRIPVGEFRVSATWRGNQPEFRVFYRWRLGSGSGGSWGWKLATDADDVHNFLNGLGAYTQPVKDAQIAAFWQGNHREFYVFYKRSAAGETVGSWGWKKATPSTANDVSDALYFLNGQGAYEHPATTARVAALDTGHGLEIYCFYQRATQGEPIDNWSCHRATSVSDARNYVNGWGSYSQAVPGFQLASLGSQMYVFANQGTQVWLQRPLVQERFVQGEPIQLLALVTSDAPIDGSDLLWTSDRDGTLGHGPNESMTQLSVGNHTLTVAGYGLAVTTPVRLFADLSQFYQAEPAASEIARLEQDFTFQWVNGTGTDEQWSTYPDIFDQTSTDPSKRVAYAKLDVLRHQAFSEPLPFTSGKSIYDHVKTYIHTLNLRLDCHYNTGSGAQVSLNRSFSVWDSRTSGTPSNPNACKQPFTNPTLHPYVSPLYLLVHEGRHSEPGDPGHTSCGGSSNMDAQLENGSGHAWAALYTMWVYKYGQFDPPAIKAQAKAIATSLLNSRFCSAPTHSNPKVQAIVDELLHPQPTPVA